MKRKLFLLSAVLSMLMCGAVAWWWTSRSATSIDQVTYQSSGADTMKLWASDGKFMLTRTKLPAQDGSGVNQLTWGSTPCNSQGSAVASAKSKMAFSMFAYGAEPLPAKAGGGTETTIIVPAWMLIAVFAVLPMTWVAGKLKRKDKKKPAAA